MKDRGLLKLRLTSVYDQVHETEPFESSGQLAFIAVSMRFVSDTSRSPQPACHMLRKLLGKSICESRWFCETSSQDTLSAARSYPAPASHNHY